MQNRSRYQQQSDNISTGTSDLQWLEDGINFLGAWMKDTLFPETSKPVKPAIGSGGNKGRKRRRRVLRIREREVEIFIDD